RRPQAAWNVITHIRAAVRPPTSPWTRSFISFAARFVNVIARISPGGADPDSIRWATRWVRTRVLPDPAPATTSIGPSVCTTASRCWGLSASSLELVAAPAALTSPWRDEDGLRSARRSPDGFYRGARRCPGEAGRPLPGAPGSERRAGDDQVERQIL